jgi:hypothetical protein
VALKSFAHFAGLTAMLQLERAERMVASDDQEAALSSLRRSGGDTTPERDACCVSKSWTDCYGALRFDATPQHVCKPAEITSQPAPPIDEGLWPDRARCVARDIPEKLAGDLSQGHCSLTQHVDWINDLRVTKPVARYPTALYAPCALRRRSRT